MGVSQPVSLWCNLFFFSSASLMVRWLKSVFTLHASYLSTVSILLMLMDITKTRFKSLTTCMFFLRRLCLLLSTIWQCPWTQINGQRASATSELLHISYELFVLATHDIVIIIQSQTRISYDTLLRVRVQNYCQRVI